MSGKQARRARQAAGYVKPPKTGTPLEDRRIDPVFDRASSSFHPSKRQHRKIAEAIKIRDGVIDD